MRTRFASCGDFKCAHCHIIVSSAHLISAVNNRNHCPYCLWSCHLDLFTAGDRLSACKAPMKPIGLTMKRSRNKYRLEQRGELMLVHECIECKALSINRIAADDDSEAVIVIFQESLTRGHHVMCHQYGINLLQADDTRILYKQLYGSTLGIPAIEWR